MLSVLLALIIAYFIGSISFAGIITHYSQLPDLRTQGLGTLSSENVLMVMGKEKALATILLDGLKGFIVIFIAKSLLNVTGFWLGMTLFLTVIGHLYSVYYNFRGGNGIAVALGGLFLMSFWGALILLIAWFAVVIITHYVYLATLLIAILMPILMLLFGHFSYFIPTGLIAAVIFWRNMDHFNRIRAGTEARTNW